MATTSAETELFDPGPYQLPAPIMDGQRATKARITFAGSIEIDMHDEQDLQLLGGMLLGRAVGMRVTATVAKIGWAVSPTKEHGNVDIVDAVTLRVEEYELLEGASS